MPSLSHAVSVILAVLAFHAIGLFYDLYVVAPWYDIPMHFLGGFAMGVLGLALVGFLQAQATVGFVSSRYAELLGRFWLVIGFVAIIGIAWEWHEFLFGVVFHVDSWSEIVELLTGSAGPVYSTPAQPSVGDTMADFFFDLLGGVVAFLAYQWSLLRK